MIKQDIIKAREELTVQGFFTKATSLNETIKLSVELWTF